METVVEPTTIPDSTGTLNRSVRRASLVAGLGLALMAVLGAFANFGVLERLVTEGDATQTATAILSAEGLFRVGIGSFFVVAVLDVVVAWALYEVFTPVSRSVSTLMAWLRLAYTAVFVVAIGQLVVALRLLNETGLFAVFSTEQVHTQALLSVTSFYDIWDAALVLFGVHLLVLGYLIYKAEFAPTVLGALVGISGLGYLLDSIGPVLSASYTFEVSVFTFVGELVLIVWLLLRGRRLVVAEPGELREEALPE